MIAFHFPPLIRGSGYLRTLKFAQHIRERGWKPVVITVDPRVHRREELALAGEDAVHDIEVHRAYCLDVKHDLAIAGRYPELLALPDRWWTWRLFAVPLARRLARRHDLRAVFSTAPQASAHLIGAAVSSQCRLPWVADFRDPMVHGPYPESWLTRKVVTRLESRTVHRARRVVFTTPSARELYRTRYPELPDSRWQVIHNGYDEDAFAAVERDLDVSPVDSPRFVLLHSGLLYRGLRDPTTLFQALGELKRESKLDAGIFRLVLRACGSESRHRKMCEANHIGDLVSIEPGLPYRGALAEMIRAGGLLLLQSSPANRQIPAKVYEYLRARRPMLSVVDPAGDTAGLLGQLGIGPVVDIASVEAIKAALVQFLAEARAETAAVLSDEALAGLSRAGGAAQLAELLDGLEDAPG